MTEIVRDDPLSWRDLAAVAAGARLTLSEATRGRIVHARNVVESIVAKGIRAYGVNTGVGALSDTVVDVPLQRQLSRNLIMSHAVGVGAPLPALEARAILAAAINNHAHGYSGVRLEVVDTMIDLLNAGFAPEIPSRGSIGYLSHMAHIAQILITGGHVLAGAERISGAEALKRIGRPVVVPEAKEGLSLINGTPCVTGLAAIAVAKAHTLLAWADVAAAMTFEVLNGQLTAFDAKSLALHASPGLAATGLRLRGLLAGSQILERSLGARTQDALSLRAVPQVHGGARDTLAYVAGIVGNELASVTDNPVVSGTVTDPEVFSEAHAVGAGIGLAMDGLAPAMALVGSMSERRTDRLVNPLVSGLPPFLAADSGAASGFMILQYTALSLVGENRRLAATASLDGGVTSGLQEDLICHPTPAALKLLAILDNVEAIIAIELLAAAQAADLRSDGLAHAPATDAVWHAIRAMVPTYTDDRPLADDVAAIRPLLRTLPIV
ncbi:histidine ammonia-lyase [Devosia sp.]|uniref:HAL/PAL/TAL family ammonia-lyase n=1 Tax=Devosia sp. TaxID=1871048 RepID=UPI0019E22208|nr:histidine ammonia-lyase [Devosia sp.]MBE0581874.1 histidine ammonia-lyase [Devosia sp.]